LTNLDFKDNSEISIPAKINKLKKRCVITIPMSHATTYKIGIARRMNGENIAKTL
jgi:hypothetical protein